MKPTACGLLLWRVVAVVFPTVASGCSAPATVIGWSPPKRPTGAVILPIRKTIKASTSPVYSLSFSPDGRSFATGLTDNGKIKLWDTLTGHQLSTLQGHRDDVWRVEFSPDAKWLASGGGLMDGTARIWEPQSGELRHTLPTGKQFAYVRALAFSPDSRRLATGDSEGGLRLWDTRTGKPISNLQHHSSEVSVVAYSPDGTVLASGSWDDTIALWEPLRGRLQVVLAGHTSSVNDLCFLPDGRTIASASNDKTVRIWDVSTGQLRRTLNGPRQGLERLVVDPAGAWLVGASSTTGDSVYAWRIADGDRIATLRNCTGPCVLSPDGRLLAVCGFWKDVQFYDTRSWNLVATAPTHSAGYNMRFSPSGKTLATWSDDGTVNLYDVSPAVQALVSRMPLVDGALGSVAGAQHRGSIVNPNASRRPRRRIHARENLAPERISEGGDWAGRIAPPVASA